MQTTFSFYVRKLKLTNIMNKTFEEKSTIFIIEEMRKLENMRQYAGISQSYICNTIGISSKTYAKLKKGSLTI